MSLIIEALKKAERASKEDLTGPPAGKVPEHPSKPDPFGSGQFRIIAAALFLLLIAFFFGMVLSKARKPVEWPSAETPRITPPAQVPMEDPATSTFRITPIPSVAPPSVPAPQIQTEQEPEIIQKPFASEQVQPTLEEADHWLNEITHRAIETWKKESQRKVTTQATPVPKPSVDIDLRLQLVVEGDAHPSALINGKIVHVGDEIQGWTVKNITQNEVSMERNGQRHVLRF